MLNDSDNTFLQILDALEDMVLVKGPKSKLIWANRAFCRYYGMTNAELKGIVDAPFSEPDHTMRFVRDDTYVFETGKAINIPEEMVNRHDGVVRCFHTVKSPIFDANGKVIMTVGISRDVTDSKAERARSSYSAKMASLGEMAGGIAHEINTPLTVISMMAETSADLLESPEFVKDPAPFLERLRENISTIDRTTRKIAQIIKGLRLFSRDSKDDLLVIYNLREILEETLAFSRERFCVREIDVIVKNPAQEPLIKCRPTEIGQVILNLLNNAHDAVLAGGKEKWIRIETQIFDKYIELSFTDSGIGIDPKQRERLFTPFFTTKTAERGTGLGLSISKGIIESHGGEIFLDKESPNTRFVIRLKNHSA